MKNRRHFITTHGSKELTNHVDTRCTRSVDANLIFRVDFEPRANRLDFDNPRYGTQMGALSVDDRRLSVRLCLSRAWL